MLRSGLFGISFIAVLAFAGAADAHHSYALFDRSKTVTLEGTVRAFEWTNPHIYLWVTVPGEGKDAVWGVEGGTPVQLSRQGWSRTTFQPGDKVKVDINPLGDGRTGGYFLRASKADGTRVGGDGVLGPGEAAPSSAAPQKH